jgi:hypothetical protein
MRAPVVEKLTQTHARSRRSYRPCTSMCRQSCNSGQRDPEMDRPLTPHFILSVARGPDVAKLRSLNDVCSLRVKVETTTPQRGL